MSAFRLLLAGIALAARIWAGGATVEPPVYTVAGVVNAGSYSDALAPNTIASVFGTTMSYETGAVMGGNLVRGGVPTKFAGVTIYVGGIAAGLFYVSPTQINFLIPAILGPGTVDFVVTRDGVAGPHIPIILLAVGPALFQDSASVAIATHLDGSLLTGEHPATAAEWVVLYGTGLGNTVPAASTYVPATEISWIQARAEFQVTLDGTPVAAESIGYAGLAPGFAGLYQINLKLPEGVHANPEIRMSVREDFSVPGIRLPVD